eukprot:TRINITY_DN58441_c0_g1_i1.p2 TRINITY_DN58441_c0_g1~~TRINITY_DN58441_c0_g1_i1.p2  ORF type:complete len:138 (-),score=17.19 TRINITY_DN58441_c0_g1_i1:227-640(-)
MGGRDGVKKQGFSGESVSSVGRKDGKQAGNRRGEIASWGKRRKKFGRGVHYGGAGGEMSEGVTALNITKWAGGGKTKAAIASSGREGVADCKNMTPEEAWRKKPGIVAGSANDSGSCDFGVLAEAPIGKSPAQRGKW